MRNSLLSLPLFLLLSPLAAQAGYLSLESYVQQVNGQNGALKASVLRAEAGSARDGEGSHGYVPALVSTFGYSYDKRPTFNPGFQGVKNIVQSYSLGVAQLTPWGMRATLTYNLQRTEYFGTNPIFVPTARFFDAYPKFELTQSLWSGFFGSTTRAQIEATDAIAHADEADANFALKNQRRKAELTYLHLALSRKTILVEQATIERSKSIRDWAANRVRYHLADRSDLLQAEAALKARELELQSAIDEERKAARDFNTFRHVDSDVVEEQLQDISVEQALAIKPPTRSGVRDDVVAAENRAKAAAAQSIVAREGLMPKLDLTAMYSLYGRDAEQGPAMDRSTGSANLYWQVGLNLNMPLDFVRLHELRQARNKERDAADLMYQQTAFDNERLWKDLERNHEEYKRQLVLSSELEAAQKDKLTQEKTRHGQGRSTTYQVLLFEQEYLASQLARLQYLTKYLTNLIDMKLWSAL